MSYKLQKETRIRYDTEDKKSKMKTECEDIQSIRTANSKGNFGDQSEHVQDHHCEMF